MATSTPSKEDAILIIGAGTFGLSTAYELTHHGYKDITVLDRASEIPSPYSAGCDLNKIVRAEYEDPFYTDLALGAILAWQSPFFAPFYRPTGLVIANSAAASQRERDSLSKSFGSIEHNPKFPAGSLSQINSREDLQAIALPLTGGAEGWTGYYNKFGGYARAGRAMRAMYDVCVARGVRFVLGPRDGHVTSLLFAGKRCLGAQAASGRKHEASRTIVCLGADVARLIPELGGQITAKAWSVAHIQLTREQARSLAGIPVVNCRDLGFFFEPDADTGLVKLAAHRAGLTNYQSAAGGVGQVSLPSHSKDDASRGIPRDDEDRIVRLIAETMPQFSHLPLVRKFICWCGDTVDSNFIIDFVPGTDAQSLMVFSGDSGHAFKMLPVAGRWARDVLERGEQTLARWKWKKDLKGGPDDIHWRPGGLEDLKDVKDWVPQTLAPNVRLEKL
jgi:sarcosine oxidase/L-pipecolate oxidase